MTKFWMRDATITCPLCQHAHAVQVRYRLGFGEERSVQFESFDRITHVSPDGCHASRMLLDKPIGGASCAPATKADLVQLEGAAIHHYLTAR